jgi:methionyl-tRNA formyltransferase
MIVIAGKNNIAVRALHYARLCDLDVSVVLNKTDNGVDGWQKSLCKYAKDNNINILSLDQAYNEAKIFISLEFDLLVRPDKFDNENLFNIHFSNLPKYKGMYTSIWPIINNEKVGGVTLHKIDNGIDTGDVLSRSLFDINAVYRSRDLYRVYLEKSFELFKLNLSSILNGSFEIKAQDKIDSSYYSKSSIDFSRLSINFNASAYEVMKLIYAFSFREYQMPVVFGKSIAEVEILDDRSKLKPGSLIAESENSMIVSTIDYNVMLYFDRVDLINKFSECTVRECKELIKNLAGINDRNEMGWSPLIVAAYHGNHDVVRYLLDNGALIDDENYNGTTVLMYAKEYALKARDKTSFNELLRRGADMKRLDLYGKSLIQYLSSNDANFLGL